MGDYLTKDYPAVDLVNEEPSTVEIMFKQDCFMIQYTNLFDLLQGLFCFFNPYLSYYDETHMLKLDIKVPKLPGVLIF